MRAYIRGEVTLERVGLSPEGQDTSGKNISGQKSE